MTTHPTAEPTEAHEFLLLASYCHDNDACTEARPCDDCLAMCNVFGEKGAFLRELGPQAVRPTAELGDLEGLVRDELAKAYRAGATDVHIYWRAGGSDTEPDFAEAAGDYAASRTALLAELAALRERVDWRDIASAPSGVEVFVANTSYRRIASKNPHGVWFVMEGGRVKFDGVRLVQLDFEPTHWLSLPEPPRASEGEKL